MPGAAIIAALAPISFCELHVLCVFFPPTAGCAYLLRIARLFTWRVSVSVRRVYVGYSSVCTIDLAPALFDVILTSC